MNRPYYTAAHKLGGDVEADFGSFDKSDVTAEIEDWIDHGAKRKHMFRKTWAKAPTNAEYLEWLKGL